MRGRAAKFQRGLGRDGFDISDTAHAVGAENLCRLFHCLTETLQLSQLQSTNAYVNVRFVGKLQSLLRGAQLRPFRFLSLIILRNQFFHVSGQIYARNAATNINVMQKFRGSYKLSLQLLGILISGRNHTQ